MTAPTVPALAWTDPHDATVTLPDGTSARIYWDWQRDGWTDDRPGACFRPVHAGYRGYRDVLNTLLSAR